MPKKPTGDWHKLSRLPHKVSVPATNDRGLLHAWALKRCGHGGYAEVPAERIGAETDLVVFHFPTAETARDFAADFKQSGAKIVRD